VRFISDVLEHFAAGKVGRVVAVYSMAVENCKDFDVVIDQNKHVVLIQDCLVTFY
jgi:hypothetical protein